MAREWWPVLTPDGSDILPITDGLYYTGANMGTSTADNCQVYIEFYSDADATVLAAPTAGEIYAQGAPMGKVWLASPTGQSINAADVKEIGAYTPFSFYGRMQQGRVGFAGITGALTARVLFWRY